MKHAVQARYISLLILALAIAVLPTARADDVISYASDNPIYALKDSNGIFYVFYRDTSNNIRYSYYVDEYWNSEILVSGNVFDSDGFVMGYYGHSYLIILYKQWVSGSIYNVYVLKCTVSAPLSCGSPVPVNPSGETAYNVQELTLTYNPSGRWYIGYVYYSSLLPGYEYITFHSTDGSAWTLAQWSYVGSSAPSSAFRFHITAIPGTSNAFAFIAARADEGYYRYCIVIVGTQSCSTMSNTIGSKTTNQAAPPIRGIPSTSSGRAEIFTNNQWFRCISSGCTTGTTLGATWTDPVALMREGSDIYMFYMPGNIIKRRTVTSSSIGDEINYLVTGTGTRYGVGVPIEATTPRPVAYLVGSALYGHTEPTVFTVTLTQNIVISSPISKIIRYVRTLSETVTSSDTVSRDINYVREILELVGVSDYFERSPAITLPELVMISDAISYQYVSPGGGGGGGPAAPSPPPEPPTVEIPVEPVPAQPVAVGSAVVAGVLLAAFTALSLRDRRSAVSLWRRTRRRARRVWR